MRLRLLIVLLLILLVAAMFSRTRHYGYINMDDDLYVFENPHIREGLTWKGLRWALGADFFHDTKNADYWQPVTFLSRMADIELFGLNPGGHHLTNVVFHAANAALLFYLLCAVTGRLWPPAFAAALFAVHPLQVETVAWITARKDLLATFFALLTLFAYARYARRPSRLSYVCVLGLFLVGLMSKTILMTLPVLLLLLDLWPLERVTAASLNRSSVWSLVREKIPFLICSAFFAALSVSGQTSAFRHAAFVDHAREVPVSYVWYLIKTVYPARLGFYAWHYKMNPSEWGQTVGALLLLTAMTILCVRCIKAKPYLAVGWCWFLVALAPVIWVDTRADRFMYIPFIGLFTIFAWTVSDLPGERTYVRMTVSGAACILLLCLSSISWRQVEHWKSSVSIFSRSIQAAPKNVKAHNNLGTALVEEGHVEEGFAGLLEALSYDPKYADAHNNLGNTLKKMGRTEEAAAHYRRALEIDPDSVGAHNNIAILLAADNKLDEASRHLIEAFKLSPDDPEIFNNLANLFVKQGKSEKAIAYYQKALDIHPFYTEVHKNLGMLLDDLGRADDAIRHLHAAEKFSEGEADPDLHSLLGVALARQGKLDLALPHFFRADELAPNTAKHLTNLGGALNDLGKPDQAIAYLERAVAADPASAEAHNNLGLALVRKRRYEDALIHFQEANRIRPGVPDVEKNLEAARRTIELRIPRSAQTASEISGVNFSQTVRSPSA